MIFFLVISYIYSVDVVSRTIFCRSFTCSNPLPSVCSMADLWSVAIWRAEVICFCKIFRACSQFAVVSLNLMSGWRRRRRKRREHREYNWKKQQQQQQQIAWAFNMKLWKTTPQKRDKDRKNKKNLLCFHWMKFIAKWRHIGWRLMS